MKKLYSLLMVSLLSLVSMMATAQEYSITLNVDDPSRVVVKLGYYGDAEPLVAGDNVITGLDWTSVNIYDGPDARVVSLTDDSGQTYEKGWSGYYTFYLSESTNGRTFTVTTIDLNESRTAQMTVTVDDPTQVQLKRNGDSQAITLVEGENTVKFDPTTETPFTLKPTGYYDNFYKVLLDGAPVNGGGYYGNEYTLVPANGANLEVYVNYPDVDCTVTLTYPRDIEGFQLSDVLMSATTGTSWPYTDVEFDAEGKLTVKAGTMLRLSLSSSNYKVESVTVNGASMPTGSVNTVIVDDTEIVLNVRAWGTVTGTVNLVDPAHVNVYRGYASSGELIEGLVAGDNPVSVPENANGISITATPGHYITTITDQNGDEYNEGAYLRVEADSKYTVVSGVYSTEPVHVSFAVPEGLDASKMIRRVKMVEGDDIEFTSEGFDVLPGTKVVLYPNTSDYNISAILFEGYGMFNSWMDYTNEIKITQECTITIEGSEYPKVTFTLNADNVENFKLYSGSYSSYNPASNIEIPIVNGANTITVSDTGYGAKITIMAEEGKWVEIVDEEGYNKYANQSFYVYDETVLTVTSGTIERNALAALYIKDVNTIYACSLTRLDETKLVDLPEEDGYTTFRFSDKADNPFRLQLSGSDLWDNPPTVYLNDTKIESVSSWGFTYEFRLAAADVIKVFCVDEAAKHTVDFTVTGPAEKLAVVRDRVAYHDHSAAATFHKGTEFMLAGLDEATLEVKVNGQPVEAEEGLHTFTLEGDSQVSVNVVESQSGIENVIAGTATADRNVYNLQGIRILTDASAEQIKALPAGIYICGGKKIAVK